MKSMTGFGRARLELPQNSVIDIEVKSVNHRYLEVTSKSPRMFSSGLEIRIKKTVSQKLKRGKVDVVLSVKKTSNGTQEVTDVFRSELFDQYADVVGKAISRGKLAGGHPLSEKTLHFILSQPGVMNMSAQSDGADEEVTNELQERVLAAVEVAVDELVAMRKAEGKILKDGIIEQLGKVHEHIQKVTCLNTDASKVVSDKLNIRLKELLQEHALHVSDASLRQRIEQELVLIADKVDVAEEILRLQSHIEQFKSKIDDAVKADSAVGRELDFLCQEIGRECNTIGSKSQMIEMSKVVIELKVLLEQIREQVQNIE